ncbi:MAG: hypothetical protein PHS92_01215 [Candidatus Gracilibacteria bacterium]|nr:hypothetical protein [Candidatus Gracilibacteria bacterium]
MTIINKAKDYLKNKDLCGLYDFITNNQIDKETASEIFSLVYDHTSSFKNSNTCCNAMNIAGRLIDIGVPHDIIVLEKTKKSFPRMKITGEILKCVGKYSGGKILGGVIDLNLLEKYEESEGILDMITNEILFSIKGCEAVIFLIKHNDISEYFIRFKDEAKKTEFDYDFLKSLVNR